MATGFKQTLLAVAAALVIAGTPNAFAQPANCGDINNDGDITSADLSALQAATIHNTCNNAMCWDVNASGGGSPDLGDQVVLSRFLSGGGTKAEPGRSRGEQNLLFKLCTGDGPALPCNTSGTPFTGQITSNTTFPGRAAGCAEFFIAGQVTVKNGATLTVQPGALIRAIKNPANPAFILVTRGAHIKADGSADPIIFTSNQAPASRASGDWGGIVINGHAPENFVGEPSSEGLPPGGDAAFGGTNPNANTAFMRFVRIEFSGVIIGEANELNVLTMNGVGRQSTIENIQAHHGTDDCFEWFGGTARHKFLVATACGDDGLDWQIGYQGQPDPATTPLAAVQFALVAQDSASVGSDLDAHGIEADNSEFGFDLQNRSAPHFCNITAIGSTATGGPQTDTGDGARLRRGTAGRIENSIFENWRSNGIDIRDTPSTRADIAPTVLVANTLAAHCTGDATQCADAVNSSPSSNVAGPLTYPADATVMCDGAGNLVDTRYVPSPAIGATDDCFTADPSFFVSAPYVGAFGGGFGNWIGVKKCCPPGNPFANNGPSGTRCWLSFDRS